MIRVRLIASLIVLASIVLVSSASALPGDELWDRHWSRPGTDDQVWATAEFNGQLVIGGGFHHVGDVAAERVAIFDGATWAPLGDGFDSDVYALCVYDNELYAAGYFTASGAAPLRGLARWSGNAWVDVGGGVDDSINDMIVYGGQLVVAGYFTEVGGGTPAGSIAAWNGSSWSTLDDGLTTGGYASDVELYGGDLVVCGAFDEAGYNYASNIARWNGTAWSWLAGGLTDEFLDPYNAEGERLLAWNGQLVVTGTFAMAGGTSLENFAVWNGSTWGTLGGDPSVFSFGASTIGEYDGDLLVYDGNSFTSIWNGFYWDGFIFTAAPFAFGHYGIDLIAAGSFQEIGGVQAQSVARYDGSTWSALASGDGASRIVETVFDWNGDLVAGSTRSRFGPLTGTQVASWDGAAWTGFGTGVAPGILTFVGALAAYGGDLIVGGSFTDAGGVACDKLARWDGAAWHAMGSGSSSGIYAMKTVNGSLFAGMHTPTSYAVGRWNGTDWVSVGDTNEIIWNVNAYQGQLIAGGTFSSIGGSTITGLAAWDSVGGSWNEIGGSALNGSVFCTAEKDGNLYIAGTFTSVAGNPASRIAMWDGSSWSEVGGGVSNRVFEMTEYNGDIFVTGEFTQAGGNPANYVARWDGSAWDPMGSGLNGPGRAIGVWDGRLVVGGDFTSAGGTYSEGIASWSMAQTGVGDVAVSHPRVLRAIPNPVRSRTVIRFSLDAPREVEIVVADAAGRRVAGGTVPASGAGLQSWTWDARDDRGGRVAAGAYFVTARAGGDVVGRGKLTVLR